MPCQCQLRWLGRRRTQTTCNSARPDFVPPRKFTAVL